MEKAVAIVALALISCVTADPYIFSAPYYSPTYAAAYTAPVSTIAAAPSIPAVPAVPAVPTLPAVQALPATWNPVSSLSAYSYGSGYSVQELPVVNSAAAPLIYGNSYMSWPYAYSADYFYRR